MYNSVLLMKILGSFSYYYKECEEYQNLDDEEKAYMDFFNECLSSDQQDFQDACTRLMFLVMEIISKMDTEEELSQEDVLQKKAAILYKFSEEDKEKLDSFLYACIQCTGIYSEDRVKERALKRELKNKERND